MQSSTQWDRKNAYQDQREQVCFMESMRLEAAPTRRNAHHGLKIVHSYNLMPYKATQIRRVTWPLLQDQRSDRCRNRRQNRSESAQFQAIWVIRMVITDSLSHDGCGIATCFSDLTAEVLRSLHFTGDVADHCRWRKVFCQDIAQIG